MILQNILLNSMESQRDTLRFLIKPRNEKWIKAKLSTYHLKLHEREQIDCLRCNKSMWVTVVPRRFLFAYICLCGSGFLTESDAVSVFLAS